MLFSDPFLFAISILDTGAILFLNIYYIIILTDLESDYLNAQECCSKLNFWVTPKLMAHTVLLTLLLLHWHWFLAMINVPIACWLIYDFIKIPQGNMGIFDPTEIHNRGQLKKHLRDCMINLGYYLLFFFVYLYCKLLKYPENHNSKIFCNRNIYELNMIISLLEGDPINRKDEGVIEF